MGTNVVYVVWNCVNVTSGFDGDHPTIYLFSTSSAAKAYAEKVIDEYFDILGTIVIGSLDDAKEVAREQLRIYGWVDNVVYISCVALDTEKNITM